MSCTWALSALPYPVTASLILGGEYSLTGTPASARASNNTPRACPTAMAVVMLRPKKTCSTPAVAGR